MRKRITSICGLIMFLFVWALGICAADEKHLPDVKLHTLSNGLKLLVLEQHDSPTVACYRYHMVGSTREWPGMTGAAHLLEHMMFKGTKKIGTWNYDAEVPIMEKIDRLVDEIEAEMAKGLTDYQKMDREKIDGLWEQVKQLQQEQKKYIRKNEIDFIYNSQGGRGFNAYTSFDETNYYIYLPSNKLDVWAFIESDRMKEPVFREFYSERDVVYEEYRMRKNTPGGSVFLVFIENMFVTLPYGHDVIGWASDIETMRRNEVMDFFKRFYAPNNTILVLVGDVDYKKAVETVEKYFGDIPPQKEPKPIFSRDIPQEGERRVELLFDANPMIFMGYHGPKPGAEDQFALNVLSYILSDGRTSRFYRNIEETDIGLSAGSSLWDLAFANIFVISAVTKNPHTVGDLEKAIDREIEKLKTEPVSDYELQMAKNKIAYEFYQKLSSKEYLAISLAQAEAWTGTWKNYDQRERYMKVTADDIKRAANRYLNKSNRTLTYITRTKKEKNPEENGN